MLGIVKRSSTDWIAQNNFAVLGANVFVFRGRIVLLETRGINS